MQTIITEEVTDKVLSTMPYRYGKAAELIIRSSHRKSPESKDSKISQLREARGLLRHSPILNVEDSPMEVISSPLAKTHNKIVNKYQKNEAFIYSKPDNSDAGYDIQQSLSEYGSKALHSVFMASSSIGDSRAKQRKLIRDATLSITSEIVRIKSTSNELVKK